MPGNDEKISNLIQLQNRMIRQLHEVMIPQILSYPVRPQSDSIKTRGIEKLQRDGLMILESVILSYPGWNPGYAIFKEWDQKASVFMRKLRISEDEIADYLYYEVIDEEISASNDIEGLKDLFVLFYIKLQRLEKIRILQLGYHDISKLRGKTLHDISQKGHDIIMRDPEDMIALAKYEKKLLLNNTGKHISGQSTGPIKDVIKKEWLEIGKQVKDTKRKWEKDNLPKICSVRKAIAMVAAERSCSPSKVRNAWYYFKSVQKM
jgi:hypothetical protein